MRRRSPGRRSVASSPAAERSEGPSAASARRAPGRGATGRSGRRRDRTCWRLVTARRSSCCTAGSNAAACTGRPRSRRLESHRVSSPTFPVWGSPIRSPASTTWPSRLVRRAAPGDVPGAADADRTLAARQPRRALRDRAWRAPAPPGRLRGARGRALPDAAGTPRGRDPVRAAPDRAQRGAVRSLGLLRLRPGAAAERGVAGRLQRLHATRATVPHVKRTMRHLITPGPSGSRTPSCAASRSRSPCCGAGTTASSRSASPRRRAPGSAGRCTSSTTRATSRTSSGPARSSTPCRLRPSFEPPWPRRGRNDEHEIDL